MTLLVEKGTFTKTTSTSTPVDQTVTLSNGSLTPKLIILWTSQQTTNDGTYRDDSALCYGFSDTSNDACQSYRMDESAESESYTFRSDSILSLISLTANSIVSQCDVSSVGAGNFHLNWSTQSDTNAWVIHYIVAGGTDITNVSVVSTSTGTISPASYSGSGTTFTPDFALIMAGAEGYTTVNSLSSSADVGMFNIGAAKSTSKRWVMWGRDETVATSDCDMYINSANCVSNCSTSTGAITCLGDFTSFNSAAGGGITITYSNTPDTGTNRIAFLLVKGGSWDCGAFQQRNGTGTQDVTIETGLDPEIVFLGGINTATDATVTANFYLGIGASDGTNEGASFAGNTNGLGTFAAVNSNLNTKVYRISTPNATATSSTTNAECDMTGMATAGQFTLDWTTADSTQRRMAYWALGTISSQLFERACNESISISPTITEVFIAVRAISQSISISPAIARLYTGIRAISQSITISDAVAEAALKLRAISQSISISDAVERFRVFPREIAESISISDSISRFKLAVVAIPQSITISDASTRLASFFRTISQSITIADSVAKVATKLRSISETINIADSISRFKLAVISIPQSIIIADSVARMKTAMRSISQSITIADSVVREFIAGGGQLFERACNETITIADNVNRTALKLRAIAESITIADSVNKTAIRVRAIAQSITIADSISRFKLAVINIGQGITISVVASVPVTEIIRFLTGGGAGGRRLVRSSRLRLRRWFKR